MSKTYFFGFEGSLSGVLNVLFSSQYICHFNSTSENGYCTGAAGVDGASEDVFVVLLAIRNNHRVVAAVEDETPVRCRTTTKGDREGATKA